LLDIGSGLIFCDKLILTCFEEFDRMSPAQMDGRGIAFLIIDLIYVGAVSDMSLVFADETTFVFHGIFIGKTARILN